MTLLEVLVQQYAYSKDQAQKMIMAGLVLVNETVVIVGSTNVKTTDQIRIKTTKKWVSRGAYKLLAALEKFAIDVEGKICLDIGASTGGFTQVLLAAGAKLVYALDVGTNQLDYRLRQNKQVVVWEKTHFKTIKPAMFSHLIDLVVCDVSFTSVTWLFPVLEQAILSPGAQLIILIKPQFEAAAKLVQTGGVVNFEHHQAIIDKIVSTAKKSGFILQDYFVSPIVGQKSKNQEYLAWFKKI